MRASELIRHLPSEIISYLRMDVLLHVGFKSHFLNILYFLKHALLYYSESGETHIILCERTMVFDLLYRIQTCNMLFS